MPVSAIVLAAGDSTRMRSNRPKPLHLICGRPMVLHVLHALEGLDLERTVVVVGNDAERVTKKVHESYMAFKAKFDRWSEVSEEAYHLKVRG